jgi:hypothetical protein
MKVSRYRLVAIVTVLCLGTFTAGVAAGNLKVWADPDEGRTPDEVRDAQQANSDAFWNRYTEWVRDQNATGRDPKTYPVLESLATAAQPPLTLDDSVAAADLVVVGEVGTLEFRETADAIVSIRVDETLKGDAVQSVNVVTPSHLMPQDGESWDPAVVEVPAFPTLYPGDRVVLFLQRTLSDPDTFTPQPWTGIYRNDEGNLIPAPDGPFVETLRDTSVDDFVDDVKRHVGQD